MSLFDQLPEEILHKIDGHVIDLYRNEHIKRHSLVMNELLHDTPAIRYRLDHEYPHSQGVVVEWTPRIPYGYRGNPIRREKGKWHVADMHWVTHANAEWVNGYRLNALGYRPEWRYFYDSALKEARRVWTFVK